MRRRSDFTIAFFLTLAAAYFLAVALAWSIQR